MLRLLRASVEYTHLSVQHVFSARCCNVIFLMITRKEHDDNKSNPSTVKNEAGFPAPGS